MIEKNIFQSWCTKDLHPLIHKKIYGFRQMNQEYNYNLFTDEDMDSFVNENYKGEIADCYNRLNIIVAKVDFWRYLVLYKCGGVYIDMDSSIERPLNELIADEDDAIISSEGNLDNFVQWALIFKSDHPILKKTIDYIVDNIKSNRYPNDIHKMTGPSVYTEAVKDFHYEIRNHKLIQSKINRNTDIIFRNKNESYRLYSIDYNNYLCFKHSAAHFLYINKKHWTEESQTKPLLLP
jgi:mannosyltransferase OCH1-like enzyme